MITPALETVLLRKNWDPTLLGAQLAAWWNADDHATLRMTDDGSGLISNWVDRVTGNAVTATTTARPTWDARSFNGAYAGLTFDGAANCFVTTTLTAIPTGAAAGEIWASAQQSGSNTNNICTYGGAGGTAIVRRLGASPTGKLIVSDSVTTNTDSSSAVLLSVAGLVGGQFTGTVENGWINGNAASFNPATVATLNTSNTRLRIGANSNGAASIFFGGVIRQVMVMTGTLSAENRQRLEGWLAWDANLQGVLPASHPYRFNRP